MQQIIPAHNTPASHSTLWHKDQTMVHRCGETMSLEWQFCAKRRLHVQPAKDCKRCHWYECVEHPKPELMEEFKKCWTYKGNRTRPDLKGKPNPYVWDGTKEHCRRYQVMGEFFACEDCTLDRLCEHRGKRGEVLLEFHKKSAEDRLEDRHKN